MGILKKRPKTLSSPKCKKLKIFTCAGLPKDHFSVDTDQIQALYGERFKIKKLCNQSVECIPVHLRAKGLMKMTEEVYYLSSNPE